LEIIVDQSIYNKVAEYISANFITSPNYVAYTEKDQQTVELLYAALNSGIKPNGILSADAQVRVKEILNLDCSDIESFYSKYIDSTVVFSSTEFNLNHKEIICSNFSNNKDLSESYIYANPVPQYTCSHQAVERHVCMIPNRQERCPFYTPDFQHYATYTLAQDTTVFFKVYRHRSTTGFTVYTIYDNNNSLIHNLSYDANTVFDHAKKDFNPELESIVLQAYSYINPQAKFNCVYHTENADNTKLVDQTKSYIATLVSIS